jgi:hypothetical protein
LTSRKQENYFSFLVKLYKLNKPYFSLFNKNKIQEQQKEMMEQILKISLIVKNLLNKSSIKIKHKHKYKILNKNKFFNKILNKNSNKIQNKFN